MVPYKRHSAETIEEVTSSSHDASCENGTYRRIAKWWNTVLPYFLNILLSLFEKFKIQPKPAPALKEIVRAAVNSNNWIFANMICTRSVSLSLR
jgi:hypothetical protein